MSCPAIAPNKLPRPVAIVAGLSTRSWLLVTVGFATPTLPIAGRRPPFGFVFGSTCVVRLTGIVMSPVNVITRT